MSSHIGTIQSAEATVFPMINGTHPRLGQEINQIGRQNARFEFVTLNHDNEMVSPIYEINGTKRRKFKSKVWNDFTRYAGEDGKEWAICDHCKKKFVGSSKSGTTHLKNHLERCQSKKFLVRGADKSIETSDSTTTVGIKEKSIIDQESNHLDVARIIIKYGFSSLNSIKIDILHVYKEEKEKLLRSFGKLPCRFNLKIELFQKEHFLIVLHFIDDSWELKKKIIDFQCPKGFLEILKCSLLEWNIDKNICSVIADFGEECDAGIADIDSWLSKRGTLRFMGQFLPIDWLAYSLKNYIQNGPKWTIDVLKKVQQCFDYVCMTSPNEHKFQIAIDKAMSMGKKVTFQGFPQSQTFDDFKLLESALGLKEAFCELELIYPDFIPVNLTKEEWDKAATVYKCGKVLKDAACKLYESKYTTANVYFPMVCDIYMKLLIWEKGDNYYVREVASCMRESYFDKYWRKCNLVLVITTILDPRFKMDIVERWYKVIYGSDANVHLEDTIIGLTNVYNEYAKGLGYSKSSTSGYGDANSASLYKMLDAMGRPCTFLHHVDDDFALPKSELDRYLKDSKFPLVEEFDILSWWRVNSPNFPTLAMIARDFLSIPISSSFASSKFFLETEMENIIQYKGLDVDIKRALLCSKIWLHSTEVK